MCNSLAPLVKSSTQKIHFDINIVGKILFNFWWYLLLIKHHKKVKMRRYDLPTARRSNRLFLKLDLNLHSSKSIRNFKK